MRRDGIRRQGAARRRTSWIQGSTLNRVAAIDVGTNTVRLLVADAGDRLHEIDRDLVITRLGQGVDSSKQLQPDAVDRTVKAIADFAKRARARGATEILVAGTSAVRDAANRATFADAVFDATGLEMRVLSGDQEARFAFSGAAHGLDLRRGAVVCDIGGGSTELVAGDSEVRASISVDAGSVRLTERHIENDPPTPKELARLRSQANDAIRTAVVHLDPVLYRMSRPALIGVAGTVTTLAAFMLALDTYDRAAVHGARLAKRDVSEGRAALAAMTSAERRAIPTMPAGREDVIVAGVVILEEIMDLLDFSAVVVSESDLLDGLALSLIHLG